ncbi:hypothetical protein [Streptomyces sp. MNP-20]|uniref:hypothetical protein n=1 Tax=Streptomyces sp. MNP-20 TaxID=2721165 RepID=UPI001553D78A|nr:hypothetical protein [Streptomyces sp. MNP-20]
MRPATALVALVVAAALTLSACGDSGGDDDSEARDDWAPPPSRSMPTDLNAPRPLMSLGHTAHTAGALHPPFGPGGGMLDITPTTITYVTRGTGQEPEHDIFAVVACKATSTKAVAAAETVPAEGKSWQWIAPDGQAVDAGDGFSAPSVNPRGFTGSGTVQPGAYEWRTVIVDLEAAQRGGTLVYTDGEDEVFRWKMPAKDTGAQLPRLKAALKR